jgi:DNA-binding NtrC family response regulator
LKKRVKLVAIDDDPQSLELLTETLEQDDLEILTASDAQAGYQMVVAHRPPIVILDLMLPGITGMELLEKIVAVDPAIDIILLTAHYSTEAAVEAIQKGAADYCTKPVSTRRLRERVDEIVAEARHRQTTSELDEELLEASRFHGMIGRSPLMREMFARVLRVAPHYRTALVTGPTGCGKELAARALHELSPAAKGPFVVCNCAALPEHLVESELFGSTKGAYTGAVLDKAGLFEYANRGTLLLDEIGEMPLNAQAKLLRAVQQQEIQRVGSPATHKINVRVIAATHRDLRALVRENRFREDLFFRLAMVEIRLPALSERREDLPLLLRHFVEHFAAEYNKPIVGLTRRAEAAIARHSWPGNVRELEGVTGYATMMAHGTLIDVGDLPEQFRTGTERVPEEMDLTLTMDALQKLHARRVLVSLGGNKVQAAQQLGISRATLYRLLADE